MAAGVDALGSAVTMAFGRALEFCARHGRWGLIVGLLAGLLLPDLAQLMRPWLPEMVAALLGITAFRIGYRASVGQIWTNPRVVLEVLVLQLALPGLAIAAALIVGLASHIAALALILLLAAPAISGSPNFAVLVGREPAPAMQVLVLGTALFPLTALPVFMFLASVWGGIDTGLGASVRMIVIILGATGLGFAARAIFLASPSANQLRQLDGLGVLALAVIVIGLMAGIGPVLERTPLVLGGWILFVFAVNFGLQAAAFLFLTRRGESSRSVPLSIIAGNRNVALFLLALPNDVIDPLLPFIGCYQLPMYLTPLVFERLYRPKAG